jgi:hypothetical protein
MQFSTSMLMCVNILSVKCTSISAGTNGCSLVLYYSRRFNKCINVNPPQIFVDFEKYLSMMNVHGSYEAVEFPSAKNTRFHMPIASSLPKRSISIPAEESFRLDSIRWDVIVGRQSQLTVDTSLDRTPTPLKASRLL